MEHPYLCPLSSNISIQALTMSAFLTASRYPIRKKNVYIIRCHQKGSDGIRCWHSMHQFRLKIPPRQVNQLRLINQCRNSHCGNMTVVRTFYLQNEIFYTGWVVSLYWINPQIPKAERQFFTNKANIIGLQCWKNRLADKTLPCWRSRVILNKRIYV